MLVGWAGAKALAVVKTPASPRKIWDVSQHQHTDAAVSPEGAKAVLSPVLPAEAGTMDVKDRTLVGSGGGYFSMTQDSILGGQPCSFCILESTPNKIILAFWLSVIR